MAAWTAGVLGVFAAAVWNFVIGYWWSATLMAFAAIGWGWALVENVRRRDDPPDAGRAWPVAYRYVEAIGLASWCLLFTTWVAADLLDGDWADALPGLAGWCLIVVVMVAEILRVRRKARARVDMPPLRRDAGHGELSLRRPPNRWSIGLVLAVYLDSRLVAELRAGEATTLRVDAGEHDLAFVVEGMGVGAQRCDVSSNGLLEAELVLDENAVTGPWVSGEPLAVRLTS